MWLLTVTGSCCTCHDFLYLLYEFFSVGLAQRTPVWQCAAHSRHLFTVRASRQLLAINVNASFPFDFEGGYEKEGRKILRN